ncbi:MAG: hypothetical protein AUJ12_04490 [Alphaproteobacteria bacterium CG1_02_46_17]|nr:MAG: hypothetical protein AUJ12_04490 [Alphaproteobacteria bacterium CG1_02_46_17]
MLTIKIRTARSGDWSQLEPLIAGLCQVHGDKHGITRKQFDDMVCRSNAPVILLVAETPEGILTGYVCGFMMYEFHSGKNRFRIQNLFVAEPFRRNRIGEALLLSIQREAREKLHAQGFGIGVENWNDAVLTLYKQMGFSENENAKNSTMLIRNI